MKTKAKERPIIFSAAMVRAILDGRKSQTRRVIKPQPSWDTFGGFEAWRWLCSRGHAHVWGDDADPCEVAFIGECCPYGAAGSRLWVRESLRGVIDTKIDDRETMPIVAYAADGAHAWTKDKFRESWTWERSSLSSIHMPRRLSRITLEVTGVRVEKLNDISEEDAQAEGVEMGFQFHGFAAESHPPVPVGYRPMFRKLWDKINGKTFPWESNPWTWAIAFRRIDAK